MAAVRLRLHHRIVISFVVIAGIATAAAGVVVLSAVTNTISSNLQARLVSTATTLSRSDFSLNPTILRTVKGITRFDAVTFTPGGAVVASTFDDQPAVQHSIVTAPEAAASLTMPAGQPPVVVTKTCEERCFVTYQPIEGRPNLVVALVANASAVTEASRDIQRTLLLAAIAGLIAVIIVSEVVARRVTAPLDALVAVTREAVPGVSNRRAAEGPDEVGRLGAAFNHMLGRLETSQAALVRSEKLALAGLLAARVAHDIRNPLSSIKMQTQLLRARRETDADDRAIADSVLHDIRLVESVVSDLLELARPGDMRLVPASLNSVVLDAIEQMAPQLQYHQIHVETSFDENLPCVPIDAARLRQALLNVIVNAADAMPEGGTLSVATRLDSGGSTVSLDVCDDGVGLDSAVADRVFDPFVSTKPEGVGLGLVNARFVVERHGGSIALASRAPRGTRATITLPTAAGGGEHEGAHG